MYPSLLLVYLPMAFLLLLWPVTLGEDLCALLWDWGRDSFRLFATHADTSVVILTVYLVVFAIAVWWVILGLVFRVWPILATMLFRPFADWFSRKWAKRLIFLGLALTILCIAFAILTVA